LERAAVLEGGSGAFAIRRENKSKYIVTINADGEVVDLPITVTKHGGKKRFALCAVEYPTLDQLVASLGEEGVLERLTGGRIGAETTAFAAPREAHEPDAEAEWCVVAHMLRFTHMLRRLVCSGPVLCT
jgi:MOSC domain-containing protein YiiM